MARLGGWSAHEGPQPVALRCLGYTGAHLNSQMDEPGAPEVIGDKRGIPMTYLTAMKVGCSIKVTWSTAQLKFLYINAHSMGNKHEEMEAPDGTTRKLQPG